MLLFISRPDDVHTDWVEAECQRRGIDYYRFCTKDFPAQAHLSMQLVNGELSGTLETTDATIDLSTVTGVWHRRPDPPTLHEAVSAEYQMQAMSEAREALLSLYRTLSDRIWVNPPDNDRTFGSKIFQYRLANEIGFSIPDTLVTNEPLEARAFFESCQGAMIYKPMGAMTIVDETEAEFSVYTTLITDDQLEANLEAIHIAPCMFQGLVPKAYELRVNVIGQRVMATAIYSQDSAETEVDYRVNTDSLTHAAVTLPDTIQQKCLAMLRKMGLRMGNFDFIVTPENDYVFLEVNVNGQWAWVEKKVGWPICQALVDELSGTNTLPEFFEAKQVSQGDYQPHYDFDGAQSPLVTS